MSFMISTVLAETKHCMALLEQTPSLYMIMCIAGYDMNTVVQDHQKFKNDFLHRSVTNQIPEPSTPYSSIF